MNLSHKQERGSVFVIILIAVALFAALSYAVFEGGQAGESSLTKEQSKLAAQEIISMADSIAMAVSKLRLSRCDETQLNFDTPQTGGIYANASAPADDSCDIFKPAGGHVGYVSVPTNYQRDGGWPQYGFLSQYKVENIGTANTELVLWVWDLTMPVCTEINQMLLGLDPQAETLTTATQDFQGSFASVLADGIGDDVGSIYAGKSSGCMDDGSGAGTFYKVLIAR